MWVLTSGGSIWGVLRADLEFEEDFLWWRGVLLNGRVVVGSARGEREVRLHSLQMNDVRRDWNSKSGKIRELG